MRRRQRGALLDFSAVRTELGVPATFPAEALATAARAAARPRLPDHDARDLDLVTVDPPGSLDLDQAFHLARRGAGYRVSYAIADVAAFVAPGDAVDAEARVRGETLYCPDVRTPLHPPTLGEGAASLLPGRDRPAVLWTVDLDSDGRQVGCHVRRALVRSRARLDYAALQAGLATLPGGASLLPDVGRRRVELARERGAVDLGRPEQEVVATPDGGWALEFRRPLDVEDWNAQLSLLCGMAAGRLMLDGGVGLLRTLPPPRQHEVDDLRHAARALGIDWPRGATPGQVVSDVDPGDPQHAAFLEEATELLHGAGYTAFDGTPPDQPLHAGVAAVYAHVTAPIRRLCDRFATEVCLALAAEAEVPTWARQALPDLPGLMAASASRAHHLDRAVVDLTEATVLAARTGEVFDAAVVEVDDHGGVIVLSEPAVRARCHSPGLPLGERIRARLVEADPPTRTVRFERA